jgi:hypothetical protein
MIIKKLYVQHLYTIIHNEILSLYTKVYLYIDVMLNLY